MKAPGLGALRKIPRFFRIILCIPDDPVHPALVSTGFDGPERSLKARLEAADPRYGALKGATPFPLPEIC